MKTPNLPRKILLTFLSLTSLSAQAGEIWLKAGGKYFKVDVRADEADLAKMKSGEILEQLRGAEIQDVPMYTPANGAGAASPTAHPALWTEGQELKSTWTEPQALFSTWTEKRVK